MSGGGLQPHRKGSMLREPGPVLDAMRRGADAGGHNPADMQRQAQQPVNAGAQPMRRARTSRPSRASRQSR